jgi:hypothetical protein
LIPLRDDLDSPDNALIEAAVSSKVEKLATDLAGAEPEIGEDAPESGIDTGSQVFRDQTSLGISFLTEWSTESSLLVAFKGARYEPFDVRITQHPREWWVRRPLARDEEFAARDLQTSGRVIRRINSPETQPQVSLDIEVKARPYQDDSSRQLITVTVTNRSDGRGRDRRCVFQTELTCMVVGPNSDAAILAYPTAQTLALDHDERSAGLLYRDRAPFAVGHGCAADWELARDGSGRAVSVSSSAFPTVEVAPITPDISRPDGTSLAIPMRSLSGIDGGLHLDQLRELVDHYRAWIDEQFGLIDGLHSPENQETALRHLDVCRAAAQRVHSGIEFLARDRRAARAFELANRAMLLQRVRSRAIRRQLPDEQAGRLTFSAPNTSVEESLAGPTRAEWRPFQMAFILSNLESTALADHPDRLNVDLLWFPTGGGKTEAYLGLAAFAIFYRRIGDPADVGVTVLMRYTLRLLTAQQFQRAAALICAMEYIRREIASELGAKPISIGMWVGGGSTPNRRKQAIDLLERLAKFDTNLDASFVLDACPWCGAQLIPSPPRGRGRAKGQRSLAKWGYEKAGSSVRVHCTDNTCAFASTLPVLVVDDEIYDSPPDFLLGTVDKFAQLAWRDDARAIFGFGATGEREAAPPSLIIQDELHLIAGPLGSIAGGYEGVIEELCTDRRDGDCIRPKIIASTATIRGFREHVQALFGRDQVSLFPPPGVNADDSFFARVAIDQNGRQRPGKRFVGVMAPGYKTHQNAIARVVGTFHQLVGQLPDDDEVRNPWWTNLMFFGSLRELGNSLTLVNAGMPTFVRLAARRFGKTEKGDLRFIRNPIELTGRLSGADIPKQLAAIETNYRAERGKYDPPPVDLCLATNIIEVGVDVDRLSVMTVVGQPKATASYIQATGRIGRLWQEQPGLVLTVFSPSRARDRSYYEQFRSVHEQLYAQVEPTTLTPFAPPAVERTLHGAMLAYVRQRMPIGASPDPLPRALIDEFWTIYKRRIELLPKTQVQLDAIQQVFERRRQEWAHWQHTAWEDTGEPDRLGLARRAGETVSNLTKDTSWPVLSSMRNVDADCRLSVPLPSAIPMAGEKDGTGSY